MKICKAQFDLITILFMSSFIMSTYVFPPLFPSSNDFIITIQMLSTGLRRRRQNAEKYVTDPSQLNLRFTRPKSRPVIR